MAALILPSRRVVQPQGPVEPVPHPAMTRAMLAQGPNLTDLIRNDGVTVTGTFTGQANAQGYGRRNNSINATNRTAVSLKSELSTSVTLIWTGVVHQIGGTTFPFFRNQQTQVFPENATSRFWGARFGLATNRISTTPINLGVPTTYVFTQTGTVGYLYVDGAIVLDNPGGGTVAFAGTHAIDSNSGFAQSNDITTNAFWIFDKGLPQPEALEYSRNPWQLFRPIQRRIWVPVAGGGGEATGNLAATEAGSDTAAFSAASTASGSLATTETGSDTAAIAGQLTATGNLAAAEVGSDTAAISGGNPAAIGSMAAQETGADTASIAGIAPATGTLTAQETGTDTASITGASVVTGSLAATEVGSDSFFATSGAQQSVGTLAAQEVGSDTANASGAVTAQGAFAATESGGDSAIMTGEARVMGLFAATETGQDVFSGTSIQLPARTGSMATTETGADGAALSGQSLVMGLFTAQEFGSDVFFASENDLTRIRPIQATYNTLAIDAGYNTIEIDPTYWIH